jgi:glycyl-radical enzyme activating protein
MAPRDPQEGLLFDLQRFSLHDGPGIRSTVFFKGCPLRCRWCQNPESHTCTPEMAFYQERCQACFCCEAVCPEQAITRRPEARIDFARCSACGACAAVCDSQAIVTIGQRWPVDRLVAEIEKDRDFFEDSGGGVTLSGGEPMGQHAFLACLLPALKARGRHVALETCGVFTWQQMEPLLPHLDLIYFDLKHMAPDIHRDLTGRDNTLIQSTAAAGRIAAPNRTFGAPTRESQDPQHPFDAALGMLRKRPPWRPPTRLSQQLPALHLPVDGTCPLPNQAFQSIICIRHARPPQAVPVAMKMPTAARSAPHRESAQHCSPGTPLTMILEKPAALSQWRISLW